MIHRICFFNSTPFWGGGEKWHLETAAGFRAKGHEVVVVTSPGSPLAEKARAGGLDVQEFRISGKSALNPLLRRKLGSFFRDRRIDTVVFNGPSDVKAGGLSARAAGVTQRVYRRGLALPVKDRWLNRYLFTRVVTHIVTNSEATRTMFLQHLGETIDPERVQVVYNGIDLDAFDRRPYTPVFERSDGEIVLGNVGRLTAQKGQAFLIDVARELKRTGVRFRLLIAGEGELADELRAQAEELGVEANVELLGFVEDIPSFLRGIDVFLLSSLWEGFGNVIVETSAARKPIVAFDINSNPESIENGRTGFLVEPGNVEAFASRVRELIDDEALRLRMGSAGRELVESRFRLDRKIDEFERYLWG